MNHIEQAYRAMEAHRSRAYKAWRATVKDELPLALRWHAMNVVARNRMAIRPSMTPTERARNAVATYWATLTPEQRSERQRKAAKKMWKRRKAETR